MNGRDITALGYREGPLVGFAIKIAKRLKKQMSQDDALAAIKAVKDDPQV